MYLCWFSTSLLWSLFLVSSLTTKRHIGWKEICSKCYFDVKINLYSLQNWGFPPRTPCKLFNRTASVLVLFLFDISASLREQQKCQRSCDGNADSSTTLGRSCTDAGCLKNHGAGCSRHCKVINKVAYMWRWSKQRCDLNSSSCGSDVGRTRWNEWSELLT